VAHSDEYPPAVRDQELESPIAQEPGPRLPRRRVLVIMSGLLLGMLLAALDQTIVATALPTIAGDLHSLSKLSWVVTAYLLDRAAPRRLAPRTAPATAS